MGPFKAIGNIMLHTHWAHPFVSAILSMGPFVIYAYFTQWVHVGFSDLINQIARGLFQSLRQISVSLCAIHARNPFTTRTHVLSNPSHRDVTVIKELLCLTGRRFDEWTILTKIHHLTKVPGVVEAVYHEVIPTHLSPEREKHRLGLRQTGSAFTSIPTAKKVLETLFDLLEGIWIFVAIWSAHIHVCKYCGFCVLNAESFIVILVPEM